MKQGADVSQRCDRNESNFARILSDRIEDEADSIRVVLSWRLQRVGFLRQAVFDGSFWPGKDRDCLVASFFEHLGNQPRAQLCISESSRDAHDLHFRAFQEQCEGIGVVNVIADVRIQDYLSGRTFPARYLRVCEGHKTEQGESNKNSRLDHLVFECTPRHIIPQCGIRPHSEETSAVTSQQSQGV